MVQGKKPNEVKVALAKNLRKAAEDLIEKAEKGFKFRKDLEGMCAICSTALSKLFQQHGFENTKVYYGKFLGKHNHCWMEDEDFIWDITATQFSNVSKKVVFLHKKLKTAKDLYRRGVLMTNFNDYKGWPKVQKPTLEKVKKIIQVHKKIWKQENG